MLRTLPRRHICRAMLSMTVGAVFLVLWLCFSGMESPLSAETTFIKYAEAVRSYIMGDRQRDCVPQDVSLINIAYDKALADSHDNFGFRNGNIAVTDRSKLHELLRLADSLDTYRCIILDVYFDQAVTTEADSALYGIISGMPRVFVPKHRDAALPDSMILDNAYYADYATSLFVSDFERYPLFAAGEPTVANAAYALLSGTDIRSFGLLSADGSNVALKSVMPSLRIGALQEYDPEGVKQYYNLGEDILAYPDMDVVSELMDDKIVIVGDLTDRDMHPTFRGMVAGPVLHYDVLHDLMQRHHVVSWTVLLLVWLCFSAIVYYVTFKGPHLVIKDKTLNFIIGFVGLSTILSLVGVSLYMVFDIVFDIVMTAAVFALYRQIVMLKRKSWKIF